MDRSLRSAGDSDLPDLITGVPGPASREWLERLRRVECRNTVCIGPEFPVVWERARGANVWDVDGNRYVDLTSAFAVAGWGHGHPALTSALQRQAGELLHGMGDVHPPRVRIELAERLAAIAPGRLAKCLFTGSGSDAVEAALKTARLATGRRGVLAFRGGYHGLGYGALEATERIEFRAPFLDQLGCFVEHVPYPYCYRCPLGRERAECGRTCLPELRRRLDNARARIDAGAVLVEPVLGRGGEVVPPAGFLQMLRTFCDERGLVLIADEIYTGFGRTGRAFGVDHDGVVPDLMCLGKGLTGGFPLSCCIGLPEVMDAWPESTGEAIHTSTYLGHPAGCAQALAALDLFEAGLGRDGRFAPALAIAAIIERWAAEVGGRIDGVGEVRGVGAMWGIELVTGPGRPGRPDGAGASRVVSAMLRAGYLALGGGAAGQVVSFAPPFVIAAPVLETALDRVAECLARRTR